MQGNNEITIPIHLHGTLAANATGAFRLPWDSGATLKEISAVGSNANDAKLTFGPSTDTDGILVSGAIGDSLTPVVFDRDDWDGALYTDASNVDYPHFDADVVYVWALDYDGASGTAAANVTLLFTFEEG